MDKKELRKLFHRVTKMSEKLVGYVCPNCGRLNKEISIIYSEVNCYSVFPGSNGFSSHDVMLKDTLDSELMKIEFECGCSTESYGVDDIELWLDEEDKTITCVVLSEMSKEEQDKWLKENGFEGYEVI